MIEKDLKLVRNNYSKFESALQKQNIFISAHLKNDTNWATLNVYELKNMELLAKISKNINSLKEGNAPSKVKSAIKMLHYLEDSLIGERAVIKGQTNDDDMLFSFDAILKRSIMRTRKLVERLTYNL